MKISLAHKFNVFEENLRNGQRASNKFAANMSES
jgi:hypothetical protein